MRWVKKLWLWESCCRRVGGLGCKYVWRGRMIGESIQVLWGTRQGDIRQQRRKKSWWRRVINLIYWCSKLVNSNFSSWGQGFDSHNSIILIARNTRNLKNNKKLRALLRANKRNLHVITMPEQNSVKSTERRNDWSIVKIN